MYRIHNNLHNDVIDLRLAKRRFLTDAEVFEFAKMNGANKTERTKLIQYNKNFKDHHVFSVRTYKQVPAERSKVLRTADNLLRDLNIPRKNKNRIYFLPKFGERFNSLIFIEELKERGNRNKRMWLMKCDCGKEKPIYYFRIIKNLTKSCGCLSNKTTRQIKWKGYGEISGSFWNRVYKGSVGRKLEFNITIQYCWELFLKQNRKCYLSGCDLQFCRLDSSKQTASIDRIDSNQGYTEGNIQWVHKEINMAKQKMNNEKFIELCNKVTNYNKNKELRHV